MIDTSLCLDIAVVLLIETKTINQHLDYNKGKALRVMFWTCPKPFVWGMLCCVSLCVCCFSSRLFGFPRFGHSPSKSLPCKCLLVASDAAKKLPPHPLIFALFLVRLQHCVSKLFAGVNFQRPGASLALGRGRVHVGGRCSPKMSGKISKLRGVGQPNSSGHLDLFLFGVVVYLRGDVANNPYFLEGSVPSQHLRRVTCV